MLALPGVVGGGDPAAEVVVGLVGDAGEDVALGSGAALVVAGPAALGGEVARGAGQGGSSELAANSRS